MNRWLLLLLVLGVNLNISAHDLAHSGNDALQCWHFTNNKEVEASFLLNNKSEIFLEHSNGLVSKHNIYEFSLLDQKILLAKVNRIEQLNASRNKIVNNKPFGLQNFISFIYWLTIIALVFHIVKSTCRRKMKYALVSVVSIMVLSGFRNNFIGPLSTDPLFIDAAFEPHKNILKTHWDDTWFYVENNGLPDHTMMKGITKWQQQVPLPQCYNGNNAWQIPLNPEIATNPIPVNQMHFLRGAIAIATNGISIFNPFTTSGQDAFADGQLDIYGGHSGRADDYHYHIAPFHLQDDSKNLPIAFALDGFAIYGTKEPDGSPMQVLDEFHGHFGSNGVYHYHGTKEAPYMIAKMKGVVTEDATQQLIPQPRAHGVRPALTPLTGASIIDFQENGKGNGYLLTYTRNNQEYHVDYSWTTSGKYTYHFINGNDTITEVYDDLPPCETMNTVNTIDETNELYRVFPNPANTILYIDESSTSSSIGSKEVTIYNLDGSVVYHSLKRQTPVDIAHLKKGQYILVISNKNKVMFNYKFIKQ